MIIIVDEAVLEVVSHFGHFSYNLNCPVCHEPFEDHCDSSLKVITCPYCKTQLKLSYQLSSEQFSA
jgi:uncharacterized protein YbaR (Trm112 family)